MKDRRKRVRRLKIILIEVLLVFLLVPLVLSLFLLVKVNRLQEQLEALQETVLLLNSSWQEEEVKPEEIYSQPGDTHVQSEETYLQPPEEGNTEESGEAEEETGKQKVYLTFDDGPGPYTDEILTILDKYEVKATFFVTAMHGDRYQEYYSKIASKGHTLGIHSYSHVYSEIYASLESFQEDFRKMQDYLYQATGERYSLYRFPGGSSNTVSAVPVGELIHWLEEEDVVYFDWNVSSQDGGNRTSEEIVANCLQGVEKYRGKESIVILLHDAVGKKSTVEALPLIIEGINGLEDTILLPIDEDTVPVQHISITKE